MRRIVADEERREQQNAEEHFQDEIPNDNNIELHYDAEQMQHTSALCLLGFKGKGRVPQTVVNLFVESSTQLVQNSLQFTKFEVDEKLRAVGSSIEVVPGLKEIFDEESLPMNPFGGLEKEAQQNRFYKEKFNLVVSLLLL